MPVCSSGAGVGCALGFMLAAALVDAAGAAEGQAVPQNLSSLIVGRDGWVTEADELQSVLRVGLVDPETSHAAGFLMLICDEQGYDLYFTIDTRTVKRTPDPLADGFVHFVPGEVPLTVSDPDSDKAMGGSVSVYVNFDGGGSFRTVPLPSAPDDPTESLIGLLLSVGRTATMILAPRSSLIHFERDQRIRLIFEPGYDTPGEPMNDALTAFSLDCQTRRY